MNFKPVFFYVRNLSNLLYLSIQKVSESDKYVFLVSEEKLTSEYNELLKETLDQLSNNCINKHGENCQKMKAKLKQEAEAIFEAKKDDNLRESRTKCELVFEDLRNKYFGSESDETWFDRLAEAYNGHQGELGPAKETVFNEVLLRN